jgi:hypothetical protein
MAAHGTDDPGELGRFHHSQTPKASALAASPLSPERRLPATKITKERLAQQYYNSLKLSSLSCKRYNCHNYQLASMKKNQLKIDTLQQENQRNPG